MPASMIAGRSEAKAMATKQKASRAITKELVYLLSRLCTVDATTMRAEKQDALGCASTRSTLRVFHTYAQ